MAASALTGTRTTTWLCRSCLRKTYGPQFQQIRGKKKVLNTVKVRLLEDIPLFGPQGSVLEVARGRMRNLWFPRNQAEYITRETELKTGKVGVIARDPNFDPEREKNEKQERKKREALLAVTFSPSKAVDLLDELLPKSIHFYRSTTAPEGRKLHGSVSKEEISTALRTILAAKNPTDGSRVVLTADNIKLVGVKGEKINELGSYELNIQLKDVSKTVKRQLHVTREDEDDVGPTPATPKT